MVVFAFRFLWIAVFLLMALAGCSRPSDRASENETTPRSTLKAVNEPNEGPSLQALQVPFVENQGQIDPAVSYYAPTLGGTILVTRDGELVLPLPDDKNAPGEPSVLRERLIDAKAPTLRGSKPAPTRVSSYIGSDPKRWATDLPTFRRLSFGEIYDGVSLELRAFGKRIEKVFTISPGADPKRIEMTVSGGKALSILPGGELRIGTNVGPIAYSAPKAYQEIDGKRRDVEVAYRVDGSRYGFMLGEYDKAEDLVIDPVLSTYIGGTLIDRGHALVSALAGVYIAGERETDALVARLSSDLGTLERVVYLGGADADVANALLVHPDGDVFVTGRTESDDFSDPDTGGTAPGRGGGADAFAALLSSDLVLQKVIYIGGADDEKAQSIALRTNAGATADMVYIAGSVQPVGPAADVFLARFPPDLAGVETMTIGGRGADRAFAIAVHPASPYDVYVAGETSYNPSADLDTGDFPGITTGTFGGENDAFVARLSFDLAEIRAATYVGGRRIEFGLALGLHPTRNEVYLAGGTVCSNDISTRPGDWLDPGDGAQVDCGGDQDAFIARLDATDLTRLGASYMGGLLTDRAYALDFHSSDGSVYLYGNTRSSDLPGTDGAVQPTGGGYDLFLARFSPDLDVLQQSTYLGGTGLEEISGPGLSLSTDGRYAFVTGSTESDDFPGVDEQSAQTFPGGSVDAFVARVDAHLRAGIPGPDIAVSPRVYDFGEVPAGGSSPALSIRISNEGDAPLEVTDMIYSPMTGDLAFSVNGGDGPSCGARELTLASGNSCTVTMRFTPTSTNAFAGSLRILSNDEGEPTAEVSLLGNGGVPDENCNNLVDDDGDLLVDCDDPDCASDAACRASECASDPVCQESPQCWEIYAVDDALQSVDIAVDADGRIHMCYFAPQELGTPNVLRYAAGDPDRNVEGWVREHVTPIGASLDGASCAIAVGSDGSVHIAYVIEFTRSLVYATRGPAGWDVVGVEESGVEGECSITADSNDDPHISYRASDSGTISVLHATHTGDPSSFTKTIVFSTTEGIESGLWTDIAHHPSAQLYVALFDDSSTVDAYYLETRHHNAGHPYVHERTAGSWEESPVGLSFFGMKGHATGLRREEIHEVWLPEYGHECNLAFDNSGDFHLSFAWPLHYDWAAVGRNVNRVVIARRADVDPDVDPSGNWAYTWVDSYASSDASVANDDLSQDLAVDDESNAHIAFHDFDSGSVRYTKIPADGSGPATELLDRAGDAQQVSVAIATDSDGSAHVAYLVDGAEARYARKVDCAGPALAMAPSRWNFILGWVESIQSGTKRDTLASQHFTIRNIGTESLDITGLELSGDGLSFTGSCVHSSGSCIEPLEVSPINLQTLQPLEFYEVTVEYEPNSEGITTGVLLVRSDAGTVSADIQGSGSVSDDAGGCRCALWRPSKQERFGQGVVVLVFVIGAVLWRKSLSRA
jgi:hypothetical protein